MGRFTFQKNTGQTLSGQNMGRRKDFVLTSALAKGRGHMPEQGLCQARCGYSGRPESLLSHMPLKGTDFVQGVSPGFYIKIKSQSFLARCIQAAVPVSLTLLTLTQRQGPVSQALPGIVIEATLTPNGCFQNCIYGRRGQWILW